MAGPAPLGTGRPAASRRALVGAPALTAPPLDADTLPFERPLGARPEGDGTVSFRVWAPRAVAVSVRLGSEEHPLDHEGLGTWASSLPAAHGDDYLFVLDGTAWPDPCSRWQPAGIRGPSRVLDPGRLSWSAPVPRVPHDRLVISEVHVGTYTSEGTFDAMVPHLRSLADAGITALELMPVNEFPGRWGWGYDGVHIGAAHSHYGGPEGLARLVEAAHAAGLAVLVDFVCNHVGASGGESLAAFGPYFTDRHRTPWGDAPNFDGDGSGAVREWALQAAEGWVRDLHVDGVRVDALHAIVDQGPEHLCAALTRRVHAVRAEALVVAESGLNDPRTVRPPQVGGWGFDADWADDFHHSLRVLLTGDTDGWYADYGSVGQLATAFERPYVFAGDYVPFRGRRHGAPPEGCRPDQFVVFSQNHDQVGNRAFGDRPPPEARPLAAMCVLFSPWVPMLFQGEQWGDAAVFQFFSDHIDDDIAEATRDGRRREFERFVSFAEEVPDPQDPATFERSKLTHRHDPWIGRLYRELIALRAHLPATEPRTQSSEAGRWLRVQRGPYELVANFSSETADVPCQGGRVLIATHSTTDAAVETDVEGAGSTVRLAPLAGVILAPRPSDPHPSEGPPHAS